MSTGELLVVAGGHEAAGDAEPPGAEDRRHRDEGGDGLVQGAHRRHRGAGDGRRGRDDGGARARRTRRCASSAATRSPSSSATATAYVLAPHACDHLVLVGPDGQSGKTTVGRLPRRSARLARSSTATSKSRRAPGARSREIFEDDGEPALPRRSRPRCSRDALDAPGPDGRRRGGRRRARRRRTASCSRVRVTVVWLRAAPAAARASALDGRPSTAARATTPQACSRRWPSSVSRCTARSPTSSSTSTSLDAPMQVRSIGCSRAVGVVITVRVDLGDRSYDVLVGAGARHELAGGAARSSAQRVAIVTQAEIGVDVDPGVEHQVVLASARARTRKSLATVEALCREFAQWGLTRADCVVAVGGGLVTDTGGFAAAVYHRGVAGRARRRPRCSGMVDAAIGGKTGVNLPEGRTSSARSGSRSAVLCDTDAARHAAAARVPQRPGRDGEVPLPRRRRSDALPLDERDRRLRSHQGRGRRRATSARRGRRALLNYGHTLAHALETAGRYDLRHGEAVGIGLVFAAELAHALGRIDDGRVAEHRRVVASYDLPSVAAVGRRPRRADRADGPRQEGVGRAHVRARRPERVEIVDRRRAATPRRRAARRCDDAMR